MAQQSGSNINTKFNDPTTGEFRTTATKFITAARLRSFVTDVIDSFVNWLDHVIDEDNMSSNSDTKVPTQQSVKRYADSVIPVGTTSGTNSYAVNPGSPKTIKTNGYLYCIKWAAASTGLVSLDIQSSGASKVFKSPTVQAGSGDLPQNSVSLLMWQDNLDGGSGGYLMVSGGGVPLQRASAAVSSGTMTLNCAFKDQIKLEDTTARSSAFAIAFSDWSNAEIVNLIVPITGSVLITMPDGTGGTPNVIMEASDGRYVSKVLTVVGTTASPFELSFNRISSDRFLLRVSDRYPAS